MQHSKWNDLTKNERISVKHFFSNEFTKKKSNSHIPIGEAYMHRRLPEVHLSPPHLVSLQNGFRPIAASFLPFRWQLCAKYLVSGSITEFGRREIGDQQFFGIFGRGKQQIAFAKVSINIVDVRTTEIVYSTQGAGEYLLKNRQVLGFGGTAKFDNLLRQKVLNFAITEAVNNLVRDQTDGLWAKS